MKHACFTDRKKLLNVQEIICHEPVAGSDMNFGRYLTAVLLPCSAMTKGLTRQSSSCIPFVAFASKERRIPHSQLKLPHREWQL